MSETLGVTPATDSPGDHATPRSDRRQWLIAFAVLMVGLLAGLGLADHYGVSADEHFNIAAGKDALEAFLSPRHYQDYLDHGARLAHHGPSYFMLYATGADVFAKVFPGWHPTSGRHLTNYMTYLLGLVAFYVLARRLLDHRYALLATVFIGTQPLLFGHAFVNQKDTPFLAFFSATVAAGLWAVNRLPTKPQEAGRLPNGLEGTSLSERLGQDLRRLPRWRQVLAAVSTIIILVVVVDVLFLERALALAREVVLLAHQGRALPAVNRLFLAIAEDASKTPANVYQAKLTLAYWILRPLILLVAAIAAAFVGLWTLPSLTRSRWRAYRRPVVPSLLAGVLLGVTFSIRPIGAYAGFLVVFYWLWKDGLRSLDLLLGFGLIAAGVGYLTWPYLWEAPGQRLIESFLLTGDFEKINMYFGSFVRGGELPWHYFPAFVLITLTEPFTPLFLLGLLALALSRRELAGNWADVGVLALWIAGPLFALLALNIGIYGNIRHLHFVLVPMFLVAGLGLKWVLRTLGKTWLQLTLVVLVLSPAVIGIVRLHPYEYAYYNSYVGGVATASEQFTLDRWCISYREAMEFVNRRASAGDVVAALYSPWSAVPFASESVKVDDASNAPIPEARFMLTCALKLEEFRHRQEWELIYTVSRAGATLAQVFERVGPLEPAPLE